MSEQVWLITDDSTGDVCYIRHGKDDDQSHWRTVGPFAYSDHDDAVRSAENPQFFPYGVEGTFGVVEVASADFVQAVFNGFPPSKTDVFALDGSLLPLSEGGATWVDDGLEASVWSPLFDEDGDDSGLLWLDAVLNQVAERLNLAREIIDAIGTLNAAAEDVNGGVEKAEALVLEHVRVAILPEPGTVALHATEAHHELSPDSKFWLHTQGLVNLGRPELEIRNVPVWWVTAAGAELHGWAAYSLENEITAGMTLPGGGPVPVELIALKSEDPFWKDKASCLRLSISRVVFSRSIPDHKGGDDAVPTRH